MTPEEAKLVDKFMGEDYSCSFDEYTNYNDWNNLMQVVEKIQKLQANVIISRNYCKINTWYEGFNAESFSENSTLEAVQFLIIEYIKWNNQQINKND